MLGHVSLAQLVLVARSVAIASCLAMAFVASRRSR
jgi:hypothetical protein